MLKDILFRRSKYVYFLVVFASAIYTVKGAPVDSTIAKTVATNFYAQLYGLKARSLSLIYTGRSPQNIAEYYIFNVYPDNGFIIISANDGADPILGYSSEGYYNIKNLSPDFTFWMQHYKKEIDYIYTHNIKASADIQNKWTAYKNNLPLKRAVGAVSPLVKTLWAQAPYYNSLCPGGSVAGCVATAMGQIMKYWAYPPHGIGIHSDKVNSAYGTLTAYFDTTHYNWSAMPNKVISNNVSVATLIYDCGVGVDMSYSPSESSSYMINKDDTVSAQSAFSRYFGYNGSSMQGLYRSNYDDADWTLLLENELNNGRPLFYAGSGDSGSHAWVCDGYNANGDFHMNWGWGGYEDGYYNLNSLNPAGIPLNSQEEALIGIQPAPAVASFIANKIIVWAGDTVTFTDNSIGSAPITAWQWSFPGAVTTYSTNQNPTAIYNTAGVYTVSETVASSKGNNTLTAGNYITVLENNTVNVYPTLSNGTFNIQLQNSSLANSNLEFSLYNIIGQKVFSITLVQYITQVTITVPHGVYFFRAFNASGEPVSTGTLIVK